MKATELKPGMEIDGWTVTNAIVYNYHGKCPSGEGCMALAERYGVTSSVMSKVILGKTWKHVEALDSEEA